jgi:hypothetical protein
VPLLAVFLGAGIGLALCDQMHVQAGVLSHDVVGWWVPLVFGTGGVAIFVVARGFFARGIVRGRVVPAAAVFVIAYAATALVSEAHPHVLAAVLWATGLARLARDPDPPRALVFAVLLAVSGPLVELGVSEAGLFSYADSFSTVALWLSGLYVHGAPLALALAVPSDPRPTFRPSP